MDVLSVFKEAGRDALTMSEFMESSHALEAQAREAAPWKIDKCTFNQGHVRQPIFSCLTCKASSGRQAGICATCSITCHAEHEQVELFSRRNFQCDCGTTRLGEQAECITDKRLGQPPSEGNKYDGCFDNTFCICGHHYDPLTEEDEMLQCIHCENWLHSKCILPTKPIPAGSEKEAPLALDLDDFDSLVCANCATKSAATPIWSKYAGHRGVMLVDGLNVIGRLSASALELGAAKSRSPSPKDDDGKDDGGYQPEAGDAEPPAKRAKLDRPSTQTNADQCKAPDKADAVFDKLAQEKERFAASLFLQEGWRERFCRCDKCLPLFKDFPYLLEEEQDIEMDVDDQTKSIAEIADDMLNNMPRAQAAEFSNKLVGFRESFLNFVNNLPASQDGSDVVVDKAMVSGWMERLQAEQPGS